MSYMELNEPIGNHPQPCPAPKILNVLEAGHSCKGLFFDFRFNVDIAKIRDDQIVLIFVIQVPMKVGIYYDNVENERKIIRIHSCLPTVGIHNTLGTVVQLRSYFPSNLNFEQF